MTAVFPATSVTVLPPPVQRRLFARPVSDGTALGREASGERAACSRSRKCALEHSLVVGNQALLGMVFGEHPKAIVDHRSVHPISYVRGVRGAATRRGLRKVMPQERVSRRQSRFWRRAVTRRPIAP